MRSKKLQNKKRPSIVDYSLADCGLIDSVLSECNASDQATLLLLLPLLTNNSITQSADSFFVFVIEAVISPIMDSPYDSIDYSIERLQTIYEEEEQKFDFRQWLFQVLHPSERDFHFIEVVRYRFDEVATRIGLLSTFARSIRAWIDAFNDKATPAGGDGSDWQRQNRDLNLKSLVVKVELVIENIAVRLAEVRCRQERASRSRIVYRRHYHSTWHRQLCDIGIILDRELDSLGYDIQQAGRSSLISTDILHLQLPSTMLDFNHWKKFVRDVKKLLSNDFKERLGMVVDFLHHLLSLADMGSKNTTNNHCLEDFLIHVASVVLIAGLEVCKWWDNRRIFTYKAPNLLYLQRKIEFTNSEFVDINLRLLKTFWTTMRTNTNTSRHKTLESVLELFFKQVPLPEKRGYTHEPPETELRANIISLITCVLEVAEFKEYDAQRFLNEVKMVIMDVAYLDILSPEEGIRNPSVALDLQAKIWFIKLESFLRVRLMTTQDILSLEELKNALNQGVQYIDLKGGHETMRRRIERVLGTEHQKQILTFMEELARVAASQKHSFQSEEMRIRMVKNHLFQLLLKIVLFKAGSILVKLCSDNENFKDFIKDKIDNIQKVLKLLALHVRNQPVDSIGYGKIVFAPVDTVASRVISLCCSFLDNKIPEEMIKHANDLHATLRDDIKLAMAALREISHHIPRSNFPKTNGLGFIDSLLRKVKELLNNKAPSIVSVKYEIEEIFGVLEFLRSFLKDILHQDIEILEIKEVVRRIVDAAYETEYVIDSIVAGHESEGHTFQGLYYLIEDIRLVKMKVAEICENKTFYTGGQNIVQDSTPLMSTAVTPRTEETMVGLNDEQDVIIDRLTGGFQQRDVVSIVGMPGIGKTTLAKNVYNSPEVVYHFHVRAWCCVSEVHQKRKLLLDMLSQTTALTDNILAMTNEDLELKLYQHLKQKRYLIALDDLWNIEAWDDLVRSFPNDGNGSRILITSRFHNVALKAKVHTDPHPLRLLSDAESWSLLQRKIFLEERCPKELFETGLQIAKSCKGLPLAIVTIAGLLRRTDRQLDWWKEIAENVSSTIVDDPQQQCISILELSYKHLPDYLKECFLYFGVFQEDEDIPVQKLIRLWIAEEFIRETESKSLEDLAEDYLTDLIDRSLVIFSQRRSLGGVKTCRVHDMLRNLCQSKARKDNFFQLITKRDEPDFYDGLGYGLGVNYSNPAKSVTYEEYRLCISSKRKHFALSRPSGTLVRSLLFFATSDTYPTCPYDISFISHNFKLIKVLDLECINMGNSFPSGIELLVHLRYLAASGDFDCVPSSIDNLWNLEIFLVKGLKGEVKLPNTLWSMARLRHVRVSSHAVFSLEDDNVRSSSPLLNLVTLSSVVLPFEENTDKLLRQFPYLRKLRCIFLESWDNSQKCNQFPSVDIISRLESLKISYHGRALHSGQFSFPVNLKKLTLSHFCLPWNYMAVIGKLQNLEVLKLLKRSFEGEEWDMEDEEFPRLKFLKLDTLNIVKWNASSDHLPNLQRLVLRCCKKLQAVPSTFGEIPTLEVIEVQCCGDSAEESARQIREEADEKLKVFINFSEFGSCSS